MWSTTRESISMIVRMTRNIAFVAYIEKNVLLGPRLSEVMIEVLKHNLDNLFEWVRVGQKKNSSKLL